MLSESCATALMMPAYAPCGGLAAAQSQCSFAASRMHMLRCVYLARALPFAKQPSGFLVKVSAAQATATRPLKRRCPIMPMLVRPCLKELSKKNMSHSHPGSTRRCLGLADVSAAIARLHISIAVQECAVRYSGAMEGLKFHASGRGAS